MGGDSIADCTPPDPAVGRKRVDRAAQPPAVVQAEVTQDRLEEKRGWLREFALDIAEWSEWQRLCNLTVEFVNRQGVYRGAAKQLRTALRPHRVHSSSQRLAGELAGFVAQQAKRTRPGERILVRL